MPILSASRNPRTPARAEPVGSLIRPSSVTKKLDSIYADETTSWRPPMVDKKPLEIAELNALADAAIVEQVQRQIDAGLDVITDGEQRRIIFMSSFYDGAGGLKPADARVQMPGGAFILSDPVVESRLRKTGSPLAEEATFMRAVTDFPFKVTIPAPSYYFTDFVQIDDSVYSHKLELVEDIARVTKEIVADAIAAGARWIQFDFPVYPALCATSTAMGSLIENVGESNEWILDKALQLDAAVTEDIPDDVTVAMHLCRGSVPGGFWNGSLEPLAERFFNELPHERFLLEWEDVSREGGYEPIKHVPKDRIVAMGVVSGKNPEIETEDELLKAVEEAGEHLDVSQLALCSQCGFASAYADNNVEAEDTQWAKLETIGKVADKVWGSA
jgi:5-methyltetrahydropteroyltriglutamate--homocysteine methyltransferase